MIDEPLIEEDADDAATRQTNEDAKRSRDDQARILLETRQRAYARLFAGNASAGDREVVLDDLRVFCRASESTFDPDPRVSAMLDGRREVYLRMTDYATFSLDALFMKYR